MTNTMQTRSEFSEYLTRLTESLPLLTFSSGSVCERDEEKEKEDRAQEKKKYCRSECEPRAFSSSAV